MAEVILQPKPSSDPNDPLVRLLFTTLQAPMLSARNLLELATMAQESELWARLLLRYDGSCTVSSLVERDVRAS